jgi:hypothetical protein
MMLLLRWPAAFLLLLLVPIPGFAALSNILRLLLLLHLFLGTGGRVTGLRAHEAAGQLQALGQLQHTPRPGCHEQHNVHQHMGC